MQRIRCSTSRSRTRKASWHISTSRLSPVGLQRRAHRAGLGSCSCGYEYAELSTHWLGCRYLTIVSFGCVSDWVVLLTNDIHSGPLYSSRICSTVRIHWHLNLFQSVEPSLFGMVSCTSPVSVMRVRRWGSRPHILYLIFKLLGIVDT